MSTCLRVHVISNQDLRRTRAPRLTDEHERVGHVVVAHVYHGRADPTAKALLCAIEDRMHHTRCLVRRLHAIQALTRVAQAVSDRLREQVLLGE